DTDCGLCNNPAGKACSSSAQCTTTLGTCNQKLCAGGANNGKPCAGAANCPGGSCNTVSCSSATDCPVSGGKCLQGGAAGTLSSQCPGKCSTVPGQPWSQKPCVGVDQASADAQCRTNGTCAAPAGTQCTTACTNVTWDSNGIDASC